MIFAGNGGIFRFDIRELPCQTRHDTAHLGSKDDRRHRTVVPDDFPHPVQVRLPQEHMPQEASKRYGGAQKDERREKRRVPEEFQPCLRVEWQKRHGSRCQIVEDELRVVPGQLPGVQFLPQLRRAPDLSVMRSDRKYSASAMSTMKSTSDTSP